MAEAEVPNRPGVPSTIESRQVLNDQAYFLPCWGQLEVEIDATCREVIRKRRNHKTWRVRRGWDLYNPDDPKLSGLPFDDRAALVLDRSARKGSAYAKTMRLYQTRNLIAHGTLQTTRIDVLEVVNQAYAIQSALHRGL
jgi:hypothetical protein